MTVCYKIGFPTRERARQELDKIRHTPRIALGQLWRYGRIPCRVYRCPDCGSWHLTSWTKEELLGCA